MNFELLNKERGKISFPDCLISNFRCLANEVTFQSDGIFVEGTGFLNEECYVECLFSSPVQLREYSNEKWSSLDPSSSSGLREICEWTVDEGDLIFSGFNDTSGEWNEYHIAVHLIKVSIIKH